MAWSRRAKNTYLGPYLTSAPPGGYYPSATAPTPVVVKNSYGEGIAGNLARQAAWRAKINKTAKNLYERRIEKMYGNNPDGSNSDGSNSDGSNLEDSNSEGSNLKDVVHAARPLTMLELKERLSKEHPGISPSDLQRKINAELGDLAPGAAGAGAPPPSVAPLVKQANPFMVFTQKHLAHVLAKNPGMRVTEVSRTLGEMWRNLSEAEKEKYAGGARKSRKQRQNRRKSKKSQKSRKSRK